MIETLVNGPSDLQDWSFLLVFSVSSSVIAQILLNAPGGRKMYWRTLQGYPSFWFAWKEIL